MEEEYGLHLKYNGEPSRIISREEADLRSRKKCEPGLARPGASLSADSHHHPSGLWGWPGLYTPRLRLHNVSQPSLNLLCELGQGIHPLWTPLATKAK